MKSYLGNVCNDRSDHDTASGDVGLSGYVPARRVLYQLCMLMLTGTPLCPQAVR